MDLISLYYFCEVAKELHVTKTAKRLYISQQTLSSHIQKIEAYYGIKAFTRRPTFTLTEEGKILYASAQKIVYENKNLIEHLKDLSDESTGEIRIGCSNFIIRTCIAKILPAFYRKYPNVKLVLNTNSQEYLLQETKNGTIDVAFVFEHGPQNSALDYHALYKYQIDDILYLALTDELMNKMFGEGKNSILESNQDGVDLSLFRDVPFMLHTEGQGLRKRVLIDKLFEQAGYVPRVLVEASKSEYFYSLAAANVAAFFCEESHLSRLTALFPNIHFLPVLNIDQSDRRSIMIVTNKDRYLNKCTRDFIQLADQELRTADYIRFKEELL